MVVRLTTGRHLAGAVRYNERKVTQGVARQLAAVGYGHESLALTSQAYKIRLLEALAARNPRISTPCLHVALAFHPREQLTDERLCRLGHAFLQALGYGNQPYLLYRHHDTAHPHVHLVTVSVDLDGRRIADAHLRRRASRIRRALEQEYGLVRTGPERGAGTRMIPNADAEALRVFRLARTLRRQEGVAPGSALVRELVTRCGAAPDVAVRVAQLLARQQAGRAPVPRPDRTAAEQAILPTSPLKITPPLRGPQR